MDFAPTPRALVPHALSLFAAAALGCASPAAGAPCAELAAHFDACGFSANGAACEADPDRADALLDTTCEQLAVLAGSADGEGAAFFANGDIESVLVLVGYDDHERGYGIQQAEALAAESGLPADAVRVVTLEGWETFYDLPAGDWDMVVIISHGGYDGPSIPGHSVYDLETGLNGCPAGDELSITGAQPYAAYGFYGEGEDNLLYCSTFGSDGCEPSEAEREQYGDFCVESIYQHLRQGVGIASQDFNAKLRSLTDGIVYFNACNAGTEPDGFLAEVSRQTQLTVYGPTGTTSGYLAPARARAIMNGQTLRSLESRAECRQ